MDPLIYGEMLDNSPVICVTTQLIEAGVDMEIPCDAIVNAGDMLPNTGLLEGLSVAETYAKNYPDLCVVLPVPYDAEGSAVGVSKGNTELLNAVNAAVQKALADGSMDKFVAEANEQAAGDIYEGLLDG